MTTWWDKASTAERLAQIDGGIECGLTAAQIGMTCGASRWAVADFAGSHGRSLVRKKSTFGKSRHHERDRDRAAYLRGDRIDLWGNADHRDEFALDEREEA